MQHSAVRVRTRCLRRSVRACGVLGLRGGRRGCGDLGLHSPLGSDATMMQLIPLRGPHHRCTCWHRDAPGSSRLHRAHHRQAQRPAHGRHRSCEARRTFGIIGRATRPTWQPAALVARDASRPETDVRAAASSPVSHAARRRAGAPRTWLPRIAAADRPTLLAWTCGHGWADPYGNHQPRE